MTNSEVRATFGDADAVVRWFGLTRHRLLLLATALATSLDAVMRPRTRWWEWLGALLLTGLSVPGPTGRSWGELAVAEIRYWVRRRLSWMSVAIESDVLVITSHDEHRVWTYDFAHRGRLDLAGHDVALALRLARMAESMATAGGDAHLALHVEACDDESVVTVLSTTSPVAAPAEWRRDRDARIPHTLRIGRNAMIERRDYLRTRDHVMRTLRVSDFAPGREASALETLSERVSWLTLSVHATVLPAVRARRVASRAVHQVGSDAHMARAAGFRWSARREWELETLRQREHAVAAGAALCQWALYVVVRASSLELLRRRVSEVTSVARAAGLRLDLGVSRQREWFEFQLPGGPGW